MSSNRVSILYLTADNADADVVGSLVGIVREVQGGRSIESVAQQLADAPVPTLAPGVERGSPPPALPAIRSRKPRKPRALKAAEPGALPAKGARAGGAGATILAALRKSPRPDLGKLATAIYGDASKTAKVKQVLGYMAGTGKIRGNGDGTYTVNG